MPKKKRKTKYQRLGQEPKPDKQEDVVKRPAPKPYSYYFMEVDDKVAEEYILNDEREVILNTTFEYEGKDDARKRIERLIIVQENLINN